MTEQILSPLFLSLSLSLSFSLLSLSLSFTVVFLLLPTRRSETFNYFFFSLFVVSPEDLETSLFSLVCLTLNGQLATDVQLGEIKSKLTESLARFLRISTTQEVSVRACLTYHTTIVRFILSLPYTKARELSDLWIDEHKQDFVHRACFGIMSDDDEEPVAALSLRLGDDNWPYSWDRDFIWPGKLL